MSSIITSHPVFEDNQVLTASQLNGLSNYLDQQNRLTRVKLIGIGIACGMDVTYVPAEDSPSGDTTIKISSGVGITSEGYLFTPGDCEYTRYRDYNLPVSYAPFQGLDLYELLSSDAEPQTGDAGLGDETGFVDDMAVVLFLECIDVDLKSCLGKACDENGIERQFNLRRLLIRQCDLDKVVERLALNCSDDGQYPDQLDLPQLVMPRALFDPDSLNSTDYFAFSQAYSSAIAAGSFPDALEEALRETYEVFEPVLQDQYNRSNPFASAGVQLFFNRLENLITGSNVATNGFPYFGIQYGYDVLKELIIAYNEFRASARELISVCCPNMGCFPKHLMLGEVIEPQNDPCFKPVYRNYWTAASVGDEDKATLDRVKTLHARIVLMIENFDFNRVNAPANLLTKITPSNEKKAPLGQREIPFYYQIDQIGNYPNLGTLEDNWSASAKLTCNTAVGPELISYERNNTNSPSPISPVITPLHYDLDPFGYLRVGGHLGKAFEAENTGDESVSEDLSVLRANYDLPFNFINLRLKGNDPEIASRCSMNDLQADYLMLREAFCCKISGIAMIFAYDPNIRETYLERFGISGAPQDWSTTYGSAFTNNHLLSRNVIVSVNAFMNAMASLCGKLPVLLSEFDIGYTIVNGSVAIKAGEFTSLYETAKDTADALKGALTDRFNAVIYNSKPELSNSEWAVYQSIYTELFRNVDRMITCCDFRQFVALDAMRQFRLNYAQENDPTLFSNFLRKHHGIRHGGGTPEGGTYITVIPGYDVELKGTLPDGPDSAVGNNAATPALTADEIKGERRRRTAGQQAASESAAKSLLDEMDKIIRELQSNPKRTQEEKARLDELIRKRAELIKVVDQLLQNDPGISVGAALDDAISAKAISADTIFADFFLPYLCCVDDFCLTIPAPEADDLVMPAIAMPVYRRFTFRNYTFAPKPFMAANEVNDETGTVTVAVEPDLTYDRGTYQAADVELVILDNSGNQQSVSSLNERGSQFTAKAESEATRREFDRVAKAGTGQETVSPVTREVELKAFFTKKGSVSIIRNTAGVQEFQYISNPNADNFTDAWYYRFRLRDAAGNILESNIGKVSIYISCCPVPNAACDTLEEDLAASLARIRELQTQRVETLNQIAPFSNSLQQLTPDISVDTTKVQALDSYVEELDRQIAFTPEGSTKATAQAEKARQEKIRTERQSQLNANEAQFTTDETGYDGILISTSDIDTQLQAEIAKATQLAGLLNECPDVTIDCRTIAAELSVIRSLIKQQTETVANGVALVSKREAQKAELEASTGKQFEVVTSAVDTVGDILDRLEKDPENKELLQELSTGQMGEQGAWSNYEAPKSNLDETSLQVNITKDALTNQRAVLAYAESMLTLYETLNDYCISIGESPTGSDGTIVTGVIEDFATGRPFENVEVSTGGSTPFAADTSGTSDPAMSVTTADDAGGSFPKFTKAQAEKLTKDQLQKELARRGISFSQSMLKNDLVQLLIN